MNSHSRNPRQRAERLRRLFHALVYTHSEIVMCPARLSQVYNYLFLFDFLTARVDRTEPPLCLTWAALSTGMVPLELHAEIHAGGYRDTDLLRFIPAADEVHVAPVLGTVPDLSDWAPAATLLVDNLVGRRDRFPLEIWLRAEPGEVIGSAEAHGPWMADDAEAAFPGLKEREEGA